MDNIEKVSNNKRLINTLVLYLFLASLFMLTLDKLPFFNYSSYSPSSIVAFGPAFLLIVLVGYERSHYDKWLMFFMFVSFFHSAIVGIVYNNLQTSVKHSITLLIGFMVFTVTRYVFQKKSKNRYIENFLILAFLLPLALGYLQLLNQLGMNLSFVNDITSKFVFLVFDKRVQMTSSEPSWAVIHMLTIVVILIFIANRKTKFTNFIIFSTILLFLLSFSSLGYGVAVLSFVFYALLTKKFRVKALFLMAGVCIFVFILVPLILEAFSVTGYYVDRFNARHLFSKEFLATDQSGFVRVIFPLIGVNQFLDNPLGVGGGFYYTNFKQYLFEKYSFGIHFPEVRGYINNPESVSVRNLFVKVLSEEGIVGITLFILFLRGIYKQAKGIYAKYVFCLVLAIVVNFDSYAFINFWILTGIIASGYFNKGESFPEKVSE